MLITYHQISQIKFPVYKLPNSGWDYIDGLLFLNGKIVDDTNMSGDTIGTRRLQTPHRDLLKLRHSLSNHLGIIKQSKPYYIDTKGFAFVYKKTKMCPLNYYRIKQIDRREVGCVLRLKGVKQPFTVPRPPPVECSWAGLLHLHGLPWMLYEYCEQEQKNSRRKV